MLISNRDTEKFQEILGAEFQNFSSVKIASGYLGFEAFQIYSEVFENIVENGGVVQIICGLGAWEGVSQKLENELHRLHALLNGHSAASGIFFCTTDRYHGKIYLLENNENTKYSVGSSNFSTSGIGGWLEANWFGSDPDTYASLSDYFTSLLENSSAITNVILPSGGKGKRAKARIERERRRITVPEDVYDRPVAFRITIKTAPKSNINLTFGLGRLNRNTGVWTKRPYYEVELNIPRRAMVEPLTNFIPNTMEPYFIEICGDDGGIMSANFKRKTVNAEDDRPLHECGGDFMTTPRELLGEFIKGRLILAGVLVMGERVTDTILEEYGSSEISFRKIGDETFHIDF